ncbi:pilin [Wohlfahrtiimonas populi]|uniref:pilin n=1 Tax=Wohlfahrtiimonas populi TaxID=1940240 RepID=UPI00098D28E8|nr:pilin [Wohlfahrtiimonas populi]
MIKTLKVSMAVAGLSFSALTFAVAQQSEVKVPKLDKKISREAFLRDKLTDNTVGYVRLPTQFGMAFNIKNKASDKVMTNDVNERMMLHLKKVLQDPSLVNEALKQHLSVPLEQLPLDLGQLTSLIYTAVDGPIEIMATDMNKMISPATQALIVVPVQFSSAKELDEALVKLLKQDIGIKNQNGFYSFPPVASMYLDAKEKRLFISIAQKAQSEAQLKQTVDALKSTKEHRMYAYENQIDLTGQNFFVWADVTGSRDMIAMLAQKDVPTAAEFIQNTEGLAFGVGTTANQQGQAKFITKTNTQKIAALKDFAQPLDFKTVGKPQSLAVVALPSKQTVIELLKKNKVVDDAQLQEFAKQSEARLSFNALDLLDIMGPQAVAYEDETGSNFAIGVQNKEAFQQLIKQLESKDYATHTVNKGIHELKLKNPLLDLMQKLSKTDPHPDVMTNTALQYGMLQPWFAEMISAIYGVRAWDANFYLYWNEEQNWIVLNTLPYSLAERNKAKVSVSKWLEDQGIRSSGLLMSYTAEIKGAEEAWYRDYVKFMRNNYDLLGQKFDPFSMPSPSSMKFNPTSRIGLHTAMDKEWFVVSLDYDISPFYGYSMFTGQGAIGLVGALSSFALPAYQDYTKRTYVAEGMALSTAAKIASTEYFAAQGEWPTDNEEAGLADPELITGQAVNGIAVTGGGQVYISYNYNVQDEGYLILQGEPTESGSVNWYCYQTNLPEKVLPATCRNEVMFEDETYQYDDSEYGVELGEAVEAAEAATEAAQ